MTNNWPIFEWFRFKMRCILWFLMFYSFLPSYALYLYLIKFWFSLMHLVFSVFFDFEQIIFRILFP